MTITKFKRWLKQNRLTLFDFIAYTILFGFIVIKLLVFVHNRIKISNDFEKNDYELTTGSITKISVFGVDNNRYLTYSYWVNGTVYSREINYSIPDFDICGNDISLCSKMRFVVMYSISNPKKSLIDLTKNVYGQDSIEIPKNIKHFK